MQQGERLEDLAWAPGNQLVNLDTLPGGKRVRALRHWITLSGTKDSADALSADLFGQAITSLRVGNFFNLTGFHLYLLLWAIYGRRYLPGTAIPGSGTSFSISFGLEIPFRDPNQPGSDDGSIPTELLLGNSIEMQFGSATVYGVGNLTITGGTVRTQAELVDETNTPQLSRIGYMDPNSATVQLDPGIYKYLIMCEQAAASITQAELTSLDVVADGKSVHNNLLHEQLVSAWNQDACIERQDALSVNAAAFMPLVWHDRYGKANLTKQPLIEQKGKIQTVAGSLTNTRVVYWRAEPKSEGDVARVAGLIGAPATATSYEPAVAKPSMGIADRSNRKDKKSRAIYSYLAGKLRTNPTRLGR